MNTRKYLEHVHGALISHKYLLLRAGSLFAQGGSEFGAGGGSRDCAPPRWPRTHRSCEEARCDCQHRRRWLQHPWMRHAFLAPMSCSHRKEKSTARPTRSPRSPSSGTLQTKEPARISVPRPRFAFASTASAQHWRPTRCECPCWWTQCPRTCLRRRHRCCQNHHHLTRFDKELQKSVSRMLCKSIEHPLYCWIGFLGWELEVTWLCHCNEQDTTSREYNS